MLPVEEPAQGHSRGVHQQVVRAVHPIGENGGGYHEHRPNEGQSGEHKAAEGPFVLGLLHKKQVDGNVHGVQGSALGRPWLPPTE